MPVSNKVKTVILDMYGVIIKDPEGSLMPFVNRTFPGLTEDEVYDVWKKGNIGSISSMDFFCTLGYGGDLRGVEREYLGINQIDEGFYKAAPLLRKRYRLALLSNDFSEWSSYLREKYDINRFFDVIVVSGDVGLKKPDPEIFKLLLARLAQPASECIYIDDRRKNLLGAQSLGINVLLYNSRKVPYDGESVDSFDALLRYLLPDHVSQAN